MTKITREKEKKFTIPSEMSFDDAVKLTAKSLKTYKRKIDETSSDFYWAATKKNAFFRVRYYPDGRGMFTLKEKDKGNNVDRVELDVEVHEPDKVLEILRRGLGQPFKGEVRKRYVVYFLSDGTTISVYQIVRDARIFIEVEASSIKKVDKISAAIRKHIVLTPESRSLFEIFVEKQ